METDEEALKKRLASLYRTEERRLEKEIASYYANYGVNNVIEYRNLLQNLSATDRQLLYERMDDFAAKYPEYAHLMPVRESIYRLNRLEGLERSVQMQQLEMGVKEQQVVQKHLERQAQRGFSQTANDLGITNTYGGMDKTIAHDIVMTRWAKGSNFSDRIWGNRQKLADTLNGRIAAGFARGDGYDQMVREIRQRFNVDRNQAFRLIYTEGTFVMNEGKARATEQVFDYYSLSTVGDAKVCDVCESIQDQTEAEPVKFEDREAGDNFPPIHPWCRCTFTIVVPDPSKWIDDYVAAHGGDPEANEEALQEAREALNRYASDDTMKDQDRSSAQPAADPDVQRILDRYDVIEGAHSVEDDIKATNPNYEESRKRRDKAYTHNCQRCVNAYEARRRGYDVTASARKASGDTLPYMNNPKGWAEVYRNGRNFLIPCHSNSTAGVVKKVTQTVTDWGDGARGIVRVQWRGGSGGHVFITENQGGQVKFLDPQSGDMDCSNYFKIAKVNQTYVIRTDNKEFSELIGDCCDRNTKKGGS